MIKRAGINVSPAEVENALLQHPGVAQVAVVGAPDEDRGEIIVAFVVAGAQQPSPEELDAHCRSLLSKYKAPDLINFRADLPLTTTGKLHRRALKTMAADLATGGHADG
jgi:acyl-coenzyme A synthetase/AMP-(fatty) acid ligase